MARRAIPLSGRSELLSLSHLSLRFLDQCDWSFRFFSQLFFWCFFRPLFGLDDKSTVSAIGQVDHERRKQPENQTADPKINRSDDKPAKTSKA
jgi:hypothetical protein